MTPMVDGSTGVALLDRNCAPSDLQPAVPCEMAQNSVRKKANSIQTKCAAFGAGANANTRRLTLAIGVHSSCLETRAHDGMMAMTRIWLRSRCHIEITLAGGADTIRDIRPFPTFPNWKALQRTESAAVFLFRGRAHFDLNKCVLHESILDVFACCGGNRQITEITTSTHLEWELYCR